MKDESQVTVHAYLTDDAVAFLDDIRPALLWFIMGMRSDKGLTGK